MKHLNFLSYWQIAAHFMTHNFLGHNYHYHCFQLDYCGCIGFLSYYLIQQQYFPFNRDTVLFPPFLWLERYLHWNKNTLIQLSTISPLFLELTTKQ
jgi:hypothetical protein